MIKTELRNYQQEAVEAAQGFDGFALFTEQRTGKTLVSLTLVDQKKPDILLSDELLHAFLLRTPQVGTRRI